MATPRKITTTSTLPTSSPPKPWSHHLTLDTIFNVLNRTIFSPFIAWVLVLCLRAQVTPTTDPAFVIAVAYASVLTLLVVGRTINDRVAYGMPRAVNPEREVVLITGGASGLGLLIAQMYAMKGGSVAVLDIQKLGEQERDELFGAEVSYYQCDVGDRKALEDVKGKIQDEVRLFSLFLMYLLQQVAFLVMKCSFRANECYS